ncbi:TetR/AcrR family transcriptional regulator [Flindersiella endophytica]
MTERPLRADAVRNRRLVLSAASEAFAQRGMDVSIAEIAQRAGVGKGTVFRHFATKEDLLAAIACDRFAELIAVAEGLLDAPDPVEAVREFMAAGASMHGRDRTFTQISTRVFMADATVQSASTRLTKVVEQLAEKARRQGGLRPDLTGEDVRALMSGVCLAAEHYAESEPERWRRYLGIVFNGMRAEP